MPRGGGKTTLCLTAVQWAILSGQHQFVYLIAATNEAALARALFNEPGLILVDEPTGNLDDDSARAVLKYLAEFARQGGSVLLVTHDDRAADYAQRTVKMPSGRIVT